jgi:death-on-curing protein
LPKSKLPFILSPAYIEKIHDELVLIRFPGSEPVGSGRDRKKIESAAYRPFQSAFGEEIFPTLTGKAAALFHALIADHPFENGCKRTAVIAADLFLIANMSFLTLDSNEMYRLAKETATYKEHNLTQDEILRQIGDKFAPAMVTLWSLLRGGYFRLFYKAFRVTTAIRQDELNRTARPRPTS